MDPIIPINNVEGVSKKSTKKIVYITVIVLVIIILVLVLRGSLGFSHRENFGGYNGEVSRKLDGSTTYKSDYGTVTTGTNKLPNNWPSDAPKYGNATISQSASTDAMGTVGSQVSFTTSDSTQTILDFYKKELTASGWASLSPGKPITGTQMGAITTLMAKKDNRNFTIMITTNKETGKQVVTVVIANTPDMKNYKTGL